MADAVLAVDVGVTQPTPQDTTCPDALLSLIAESARARTDKPAADRARLTAAFGSSTV